MTNKEAIEFLQNMIAEKSASAIGREGFYAELMDYHIEALKLAIKALENKPICIAKVTFDEDKLKELTDKIVEQMRSGEIVLMPDPQPKKGEWIKVNSEIRGIQIVKEVAFLNSDTLLFAAAQLKKYCSENNSCEGCIFQDSEGFCRFIHFPIHWDIDDIIGEQN